MGNVYYRGAGLGSQHGWMVALLRAFDEEIVAPLLVAHGLLLMLPALIAGNRFVCETRWQTFAMIRHLKGFRPEELREHGGGTAPAECSLSQHSSRQLTQAVIAGVEECLFF